MAPEGFSGSIQRMKMIQEAWIYAVAPQKMHAAARTPLHQGDARHNTSNTRQRRRNIWTVCGSPCVSNDVQTQQQRFGASRSATVDALTSRYAPTLARFIGELSIARGRSITQPSRLGFSTTVSNVGDAPIRATTPLSTSIRSRASLAHNGSARMTRTCAAEASACMAADGSGDSLPSATGI